MEGQQKSFGRGAMTQDQFAVVWEILEGKAAAAGACSLAGGMISISSLPLEAASGLDAALDLPAIDPPSRLGSSLSPPHPADQLHSLFTLFSTCKRAAPLLTDQYYFSSQSIQPPAGTAIMPGPLRERDPNISSSRRSSVQFLESLRPKSHLSHQRLPDQEVLSADESEENIEPRFMTSTAASSSRSIASSTPPSAPPKPRRTPTPHSLLTLGALASKSISGEHPNDEGASSPQGTNGTHVASLDRDSLPATHPARDKPLPSRPIAHVVTSSPYKEARTLIDASEKPLRRSPGSPDEEDWPALFPTQPSTPGTLQAFSRGHPARSSNEAYVTTHMAMDAPLNDTPASRDEQRPTIKMVAQNSSDNILPSSQKAEKASPSVAPTTDNHTASTLSSPRKKENATDNTTPTSLPQPKPRLIDIHSPKSRQGRRPPVSGNGSIPRPRGIPRASVPKQSRDTRNVFQQPHSDHPRGYPRMESPKIPSPDELQPVNGSTAPSRSPTDNHPGYFQRKKSAIPVPARTASPHMIPPGPAVFTLKAKVSTPSSLGGKSLSTIESADTGRTEQEPDTSTVMRAGPQRRPTLSKSGREFKHLSASTDTDPTTLSAQTETSISRPSSRTESLLWVETDNCEGLRTKRLSSGGSRSEYGPTLTISPDADELIMGRKTTPSPPVAPVAIAPARASGHKTRDLRRMAVTNEHRKASSHIGASGDSCAEVKDTVSAESPRRQSSADSIQAETFTVRSSSDPKNNSAGSFISTGNEALRLLNASRIEENLDDAARLAAVSQTLAALEGGYKDDSDNLHLDQDAALARTYMDKSKKSPPSAHSSSVLGDNKLPRGSKNLTRSDSSHTIASSKRFARDGVAMKRSSSVISIASSRPPVPAKDPRPTSKAPSMNPRIQKRNSVVRSGPTGMRSPYGLSSGYSATPSNIPQPSNGHGSSGRISSGHTMTDTSRSVSGDKRSMSKAKLTMSGFRGLFQKRSDLSKAGEKKKRSNVKVSSTGSPMPDPNKKSAHRVTKASSGRGSPGRLGTLSKSSCQKHPAEYLAASPPLEAPIMSDITQTTALAMRITTLAREEEDDSKKGQILSIATAMLGAIDSAKYAKIEAEKAAQSAREASMHQEMTRQSLIAINKILSNSPGLMGTLTRSRTNLHKKSSRPSTMVR